MTKNRSQSGVSALSDVPLLGRLFKTTADSTRRTELVVLITPRAVQDPAVACHITEEFRRKMESLKPFYGSSKAGKAKATKPFKTPSEAAPSKGR